MKRILSNLVSVLGGEAMIRLVNLLAVLVIARKYGASVLGLYGTCLAAAAIAVMFADNGLQISAITELSAAPGQSARVSGELYLTKTIFSLLALLFLASLGLYRLGSLYWFVGSIVTLRTFLQSYSQLQISILKSLSKMLFIGVIQTVHALLLAAAIGVAFARNWSLPAFLTLLLAGQFLEFLLMSAVVLRAGIRPVWPNLKACFALAKRSTPLGITYALANLIIRLDIVVASILVPLPALGQFSAANNLLLIGYLAAWLAGSVLLPEMIGLVHAPERLSEFVGKWMRISSAAIVPAALFGFWLAPRLTVLLYGSEFARAGMIASLMVLACPFIAWNSIQMNLAIATGARNTYLGIFIAATLLTVVLDYGLGRAFGLSGVATAIVIREFVIFIAFSALRSRTVARLTQVGVPVSS